MFAERLYIPSIDPRTVSPEARLLVALLDTLPTNSSCVRLGIMHAERILREPPVKLLRELETAGVLRFRRSTEEEITVYAESPIRGGRRVNGIGYNLGEYVYERFGVGDKEGPKVPEAVTRIVSRTGEGLSTEFTTESGNAFDVYGRWCRDQNGNPVPTRLPTYGRIRKLTERDVATHPVIVNDIESIFPRRKRRPAKK